MQHLNFSWLLEGSLAGAQGPTSRRDLMFLKLRDIAAVIRMEEDTISGEALELADLYEPVPGLYRSAGRPDRPDVPVHRPAD